MHTEASSTNSLNCSRCSRDWFLHNTNSSMPDWGPRLMMVYCTRHIYKRKLYFINHVAILTSNLEVVPTLLKNLAIAWIVFVYNHEYSCKNSFFSTEKNGKAHFFLVFRAIFIVKFFAWLLFFRRNFVITKIWLKNVFFMCEASHTILEDFDI